MKLDAAGAAFITQEEGFAGRPYWPGVASGVTLDFGYDLGYHNALEFHAAWDSVLPQSDWRARLEAVCGLTDYAARQAAPRLRDILITREQAQQVFDTVLLPDYCWQTEAIYPGIEALCPTAQAALVSLVYNRGRSLGGDRRSEMRAIVPLVASADYEGIAEQLEAMGDRLWPGQALRMRRYREAAQVRLCLPPPTPAE